MAPGRTTDPSVTKMSKARLSHSLTRSRSGASTRRVNVARVRRPTRSHGARPVSLLQTVCGRESTASVDGSNGMLLGAFRRLCLAILTATRSRHDNAVYLPATHRGAKRSSYAAAPARAAQACVSRWATTRTREQGDIAGSPEIELDAACFWDRLTLTPASVRDTGACASQAQDTLDSIQQGAQRTATTAC